jgi:hypothetical protein
MADATIYLKIKGKKPSTGHICLAVSEASCNGGRKKKNGKKFFSFLFIFHFVRNDKSYQYSHEKFKS